MNRATVSVDGQTFELVYTPLPDRRATYRGAGTYLRMGPREEVEPVYARHQQLWNLGFPVARLLQAGERAGQFYYIEESLGDQVLGDIFTDEWQRSGAIADATFAAFLTTARSWAEAELRTAATVTIAEEFGRVARVREATQALPQLQSPTEDAFARARDRLRHFPVVVTHGDFHAFNICERGVIDLEMVRGGFAGYDVVTGLLGHELFPPDPDDYHYARPQIERYLAAIDALYASYQLPKPSEYAADFLICKMMCVVWIMEHRPPEQRTWAHQQYQAMLEGYLGAGRRRGHAGRG
jgi:aminoglycoside phosphotransferase (APT) family kinase protein